ncbi:Sarcoma antigen 1, partial [Plecturocebus cupreus]
MENGQAAPDNVLSTVLPGLINIEAEGIPSMSTRNLYATFTHNVHEEKMENGQCQQDNVFSNDPPGFINMARAGIPDMDTRDAAVYFCLL